MGYTLVPVQDVGKVVMGSSIGGTLYDANGASSDHGLGVWKVRFNEGQYLSMAELSELTEAAVPNDAQSQAEFSFTPKVEGNFRVEWESHSGMTVGLSANWLFIVQKADNLPPENVGKANLAVSLENNAMLKKLLGGE